MEIKVTGQSADRIRSNHVRASLIFILSVHQTGRIFAGSSLHDRVLMTCFSISVTQSDKPTRLVWQPKELIERRDKEKMDRTRSGGASGLNQFLSDG